MGKFKPIAKIKKQNSLIKAFLNLILGAGSITEILAIIFVWYLIFNDRTVFKGFTIEEIFSYLLIGGIIGMLSGYFLYKVIKNDIRGDRSALLAKRPFYYLGQMLKMNFSRIIIPFIVYTALNLLLLRLFVGQLNLAIGKYEVLIFFAMVILAFLTEYLLAYLINLHIFWTIESENLYLLLIRFKKILAGAFFPLNIMNEQATLIFLIFPFAYSFYVPTQLLLGQISSNSAAKGLFVQTAWIAILYLFIKISRPLKKLGNKNAG
jgi:ABC-2 type transport system permease protein